jgi:hypothetical protein
MYTRGGVEPNFVFGIGFGRLFGRGSKWLVDVWDKYLIEKYFLGGYIVFDNKKIPKAACLLNPPVCWFPFIQVSLSSQNFNTYSAYKHKELFRRFLLLRPPLRANLCV